VKLLTYLRHASHPCDAATSLPRTNLGRQTLRLESCCLPACSTLEHPAGCTHPTRCPNGSISNSLALARDFDCGLPLRSTPACPEHLSGSKLSNGPAKRLNNGAQGRIRTSVARKERQIYSLLPLTTRPPVQSGYSQPRNTFPGTIAELALTSIPVSAGAQNEENQDTRKHTSARGSLHVGRIPLRSAFLVILLRCRRQPVAQLPCLSGNVTWSWRRDSNPRPSDYKSDALPAELRQQTQTPSPSRREESS
jgi:hypothetical protein